MTEDILARLRAFYQGLVVGDLAPADALFDYDNLVMHEPAGLPYGGTYRGKQGLLEGIKAIVSRNYRLCQGYVPANDSADRIGNLGLCQPAHAGQFRRDGVQFLIEGPDGMLFHDIYPNLPTLWRESVIGL